MKTIVRTNPEAIARGMCEVRTLFLARYMAIVEGRDPVVAVKQCASKLLGRVRGWPAYTAMLEGIIKADAKTALHFVVSTERKMFDQGVF